MKRENDYNIVPIKKKAINVMIDSYGGINWPLSTVVQDRKSNYFKNVLKELGNFTR